MIFCSHIEEGHVGGSEETRVGSSSVTIVEDVGYQNNHGVWNNLV